MSALSLDSSTDLTHPVPWWSRRRVILVLSIFVVPALLSVLLNSYGPLTVESAIRMACATIAGQTVAIGGAAVAFVITVARRRSIPGIVLFAVLLVVVAVYASAAMENAGHLLIDRLDLIAEADALG
ncbi:hypothetical protein ACYX8G_10705 [Microbacterium saperdae]